MEELSSPTSEIFYSYFPTHEKYMVPYYTHCLNFISNWLAFKRNVGYLS